MYVCKVETSPEHALGCILQVIKWNLRFANMPGFSRSGHSTVEPLEFWFRQQ